MMMQNVVRLATIMAMVCLSAGFGGLSAFAPTQAAAAPAADPIVFSCGPNAYTYYVYGDTFGTALGVRCVWHVTKEGRRAFIWYGEGRWGDKAYRHLGSAIHEFPPHLQPAPYLPPGTDVYQYFATAADFAGNGEAFDGRADFLYILGKGAEEGWPRKKLVFNVGWNNEEWRLAESMQIQPLYTPLPAPTTCGPNFVSYTASALNEQSGAGIRCELVLDDAHGSVWFGAGEWGGVRYTHLGLRSTFINVTDKATAVDLCGANFGSVCGKTGQHGLTFSPFVAVPSGATGWRVTGQWDERWTKQP